MNFFRMSEGDSLIEDLFHTALPAADLERAKRFYSEKLGLTPESEAPGGIFFPRGAIIFSLPTFCSRAVTRLRCSWLALANGLEIERLVERE